MNSLVRLAVDCNCYYTVLVVCRHNQRMAPLYRYKLGMVATLLSSMDNMGQQLTMDMRHLAMWMVYKLVGLANKLADLANMVTGWVYRVPVVSQMVML